MNHAAERDALEAKLRGRSHEAGLRMLWQAFVVMVKGEMALRVGVWRQGARTSVMKEMEMRHDSVVKALDTKASSTRLSMAAKMIRWVVLQLVKGETARALDTWKQ